jgi:hypothetical protein
MTISPPGITLPLPLPHLQSDLVARRISEAVDCVKIIIANLETNPNTPNQPRAI